MKNCFLYALFLSSFVSAMHYEVDKITAGLSMLPVHSALIKKVPVAPKFFLDDLPVEVMDLNDIAPIDNVTFKELMVRQFKKRRAFIVARVTSADNKFKHYYHAPQLNRWLFGTYFPQRTWINKTNPANGLRIRPADVHYYILHSGKEDTFDFIGPALWEEEPCLAKILPQLLRAHYEGKKTLAHAAQLFLANAYRSGVCGMSPNFSRARFYFKMLARQKKDAQVRAEGQLGLGSLYLYDVEERMSEPERAHKLFKGVLERNLGERWCMGAHVGLGLYYEQRYARNRDDREALEQVLYHFNMVADQSSYKYAKYDALLGLADIYADGGPLIEQDIDRAHAYYVQVAYQDTNKIAAAQAHKRMADACYRETAAEDADDFDKALYHYSEAVKIEADPIAKAASLYELAVLYKNGTVKQPENNRILPRYILAIHYLESLVQFQSSEQSVDDIKVDGWMLLAKIHARGGYGLERDKTLAGAYFTQATRKARFAYVRAEIKKEWEALRKE